MKRRTATCDTSVVVAAFLTWHQQHEPARRALSQDVGSVPTHVVLEAFSVLTRLPAPHRVAGHAALDYLEQLPRPLLDPPNHVVVDMIRTLTQHGIAGGSVYDGLVAATALHHGATLLSLDLRAQPTYSALGIAVRLL